MSDGMIFLTVMLTGLGCGIGCGSLSTPLLVGKMVGDVKTKKECMVASLTFALGKVFMYIILGLLASIFGNLIIERIENIYPNTIENIFKFVSILFGALIIRKAINKNKCNYCNKCSENISFFVKFKDFPYFVIGLIYAIIPCTPLIITLTYATGMNVILATLLMLCFGIANSIFSVIIYAPIVGIVVEKIKEDIPNHYKWIQIFSGTMLIIISIIII